MHFCRHVTMNCAAEQVCYSKWEQCDTVSDQSCVSVSIFPKLLHSFLPCHKFLFASWCQHCCLALSFQFHVQKLLWNSIFVHFLKVYVPRYLFVNSLQMFVSYYLFSDFQFVLPWQCSETKRYEVTELPTAHMWPTIFYREARSHINYLYTIKITQYFRQSYIPLIARCQSACSNGCGPSP